MCYCSVLYVAVLSCMLLCHSNKLPGHHLSERLITRVLGVIILRHEY